MSENPSSLPRHPNLVIIITDQERAIQHFPPDWEEQHLPNMTRLKNQGLSFTNGFCNTCMCSPSRATLFSGVYPSQHGVTDTLTWGGKFSPTETVLDPQLSNLALMLFNAGYQVHYRGKWHLCKGDTENGLTAADVALYGFEGWETPDAGQDIKPVNFGAGFAGHDAHYIQEAVEFLQTVDRNKPFCLVVSLVNPHDLLSYPNSWQYGYKEQDFVGEIGLPSSVDENLVENLKPTVQAQLVVTANRGLGGLPTTQDKLKYINFYGNLMHKVDAQIGQVLDALDASTPDNPSLTPSTWVIRLSDHGEMGMAHGGMRQKAFNVYEETMRVPYVFSNPTQFPPAETERTTDQLASLIDLVPTIASLVNVTPPAGLKGVDLSPVLNDPALSTPLQTEILFTYDDIRASDPDHKEVVAAANRIRCVREANWKYARYFYAESSFPPQYEMYDLRNDPDEMDNLANPKNSRYNDPIIAAERKRLEQVLAQREADLVKQHNPKLASLLQRLP